MSAQRPRVAILGGGMAGLTTAWRLSEPGWEDRLGAITVYQRGWRLGGKGASSRAVNGRIEEHGLHIWLGYYENAFGLIRAVYAELDRERTDPSSPIRTWRDALAPSVEVGLEDLHDGEWSTWVGRFSTNELVPGEPGANGGEMTVVEFARRAVRLLVDFYSSLGARVAAGEGSGAASVGSAAGISLLTAALEAAKLAQQVSRRLPDAGAVAMVDEAVDQLRRNLLAAVEDDPGARRLWHLIDVLVATLRGLVADGLMTDPQGFSAINDEDYRGWIRRHGADPATLDSPLIRGLYDLVFSHAGGDPERAGFGAGLGVFLSAKTFFDYRGAIFWKMQAGMGDVVFAPMYQALRDRGVEFEFFHRVDGLHLDGPRQNVDRISMGRQVALSDGDASYDPLIRVKGLWCFPGAPRQDGLARTGGLAEHDLESFWCSWPDAEQRILHRGVDFDVAVMAIPIGMAPHICQELIADSGSPWAEMTEQLATVATQAFQIWLNEDEPTLGWDRPGVTVSGYVEPFDTWASMPQLIAVEDWPDDDVPRTIAYFCNTMATPDSVDLADTDYPVRRRAEVRLSARRFLREHLSHYYPDAVVDGDFRWELLCGAGELEGEDRFDSQFWVANVDPSDLYVQSLPGTDRARRRADESGYENLYLAGDWTNCGLNAGCIEAAVLSGLKAANAVLGLPLDHGVAGQYLP